MASTNLESLFIEIGGDASKASTSIDRLIGSLNSLQGVISNVAPGMKEFASALQSVQQMAANTKVNWKNIMPTATQKTLQNMKQTASALRSSTTAFNKYASSFQTAQSALSGNQNPITTALGDTATNVAGATGNKYASQMQQTTAQTTAATQAQGGYADATQLATQATQQLAEAQQKAGKSTQGLTNAARSATNGMKQTANDSKKISFHFGGIAKGIKNSISQILRMTKSMLIRTAIRAMIRGAQEGLENYYNYSKAVGNGFSQTMDQMAGTAATMKNQLGAALASAIMTLTPALNALADAAMWALEAITALFAALGGRSTYSRAIKQTASFTQETKKAGGAVKDLLADFDELNVITSGGGGGGGGGATPNYGDMFEEVPVPEWANAFADLLPWIAAALGLIKAIQGIKWLLDLFDKIKNTKIPKMPTVPTVNTPDWTSFLAQLDQVIAKIGEINGLIVTATSETKLWQAAITEVLLELGAIAIALALIKGPKLTFKVNKDEITEAKKEIDAITKDLKENVRTLNIKTKVDLREYQKAFLLIANWCSQVPKKEITVTLNMLPYYTNVGLVEAWVNRVMTKYIDVRFDPYSWGLFWNNVSTIDRWLSLNDIKYIRITFDPGSLVVFYLNIERIRGWTASSETKYVFVQFEPITLSIFREIATGIDSWARESITKHVNVVITETKKSSKSSSNKSLVESVLEGAQDAVGNSVVGGLENVVNSLAEDSSGGKPAVVLDTPVSINPFEDAIDAVVDMVKTPSWGAAEKIVKEIGNLFYADGGMVDRGDLFIANEQGAELIGSINGKTSVANQEQIIEGISRGVESANMEQNALLRQQNDLLRRILEKDSSVRFGASAALGRTVKQSLDLYSEVVGG